MTAFCRVLVIGRSGQVARELARATWPEGWSVHFAARPELDLRDPQGAVAATRAARPDIVINAAAYTNVERAETEPEVARVVNAGGPAAVAQACRAMGVPFVNISTDYVFDGAKSAPYTEDDQTNPINAYGQSKAEGEALVRAATPEHLILRTSWVFSPFGTNFVKSMMKLGRQRSELRIVADQRGCPTAAGDLAATIVELCRIVRTGRSHYGTYHAANSDATSWHGFAEAIFQELAASGQAVPDRLIAIPTSEYPTQAARPANSVLDCSRLDRSFGLRVRSWRPALAVCISELIGCERRAT